MNLNLFISFQLLMNKQIGLKRYEVDGRKVLFYFDEVITLFSIVLLILNVRIRTRGNWIVGQA